MDVHVPRKPNKLAEKSGDRRRKGSPRDDVAHVKRRNPPNSVPSVINTAEPKQLTILGIVGSMRKTTFKKGFKSPKGKSNKKIDRQSFKTMLEDLKKK